MPLDGSTYHPEEETKKIETVSFADMKLSVDLAQQLDSTIYAQALLQAGINEAVKHFDVDLLYASPRLYARDQRPHHLVVPEAIELLKKARALIEHPAMWCQGQERRRSFGVKGGYSFCMIGALAEVGARRMELHSAAFQQALNSPEDIALRALAKEAGVRHPANIVGWNDGRGRTHGEVMIVFNRAIARLERELAGE